MLPPVINQATMELLQEYVNKYLEMQRAERALEALKTKIKEVLEPDKPYPVVIDTPERAGYVSASRYEVTVQSKSVLDKSVPKEQLKTILEATIPGSWKLCLVENFSAGKLSALQTVHPVLETVVPRVTEYAVVIK